MKTTVIVSSSEDVPFEECTLDSDEKIASLIDRDNPINVISTILYRGGQFYVHHVPNNCKQPSNIRATFIAMMCGKFAMRLTGTVVFSRQTTNLLSSDLPLYSQPSEGLPNWLADASQANYHDQVVLKQLARAMNQGEPKPSGNNGEKSAADAADQSSSLGKRTFVTKRPLCYHCRRPTSNLCETCQGVYFCGQACKERGWSHACLCPTFCVYVQERTALSTFPFGDWGRRLTGRAFQISEKPYEAFLEEMGLTNDSFWRTEMHGWNGGESKSAQTIDIAKRRSYQDGFQPVTSIPPDGVVTDDDLVRLHIIKRNSWGLLKLSGWEEYYRLRNIEMDSPVALLLTFPLTLYHMIETYGVVPCTVAEMLHRRVRIHIVGAEKELNFLDMFKETSYMLEEKVELELVFICREDMLPLSLRKDSTAFTVDLTAALQIQVVAGTYGDSLDPRFDVGSGPPDMIVGFNAGLYAYESWHSVVDFLHTQNGVVGVFTDYNAFSGMQCASLGGAKSRQSVSMNPFRQPRAMPVYNMNLPQFSNGYLYVLNPVEG